MFQLKNTTPFAAELMLAPDPDGVDTLYTVVKGTFVTGERVTLADEQQPVALADQHHGDPAASSIRVPSDVCLGKPGTDVVMSASAYAAGERPTWQSDVSVTVGALTKTVRVFGDRVWDAAGSVTWVAPFVRMPLVWERAFGGRDDTPAGPVAEPRNPVGAGFRSSDGARPLAGVPLPNVEDPVALLTSWKEAPPPAGFAPLAPHWQPRAGYAGTYDDAWQQQRAPYLPKDFDRRFFQLAPAGLWRNGYLQGGETVEIRGASPSGTLRFTLPAVRLRVSYRVERAVEERPVVLDTVLLEPDAGRVALVWRAALKCDKRSRKIREVETSVAT